MLHAAARDLQWRRKRFAITVLGTGLVFAMTLVLSGLSASFRANGEQFADSLGADRYVYQDGANGPFTGILSFPAAAVDNVRKLEGVTAASPFILIAAPFPDGRAVKQVNLIGIDPQGIGMPAVTTGRALSPPGRWSWTPVPASRSARSCASRVACSRSSAPW